MAIASFFAGSLPLTLSLSQKQMRAISAIGTGVLVGTALVVIIPEGIETLYSSSAKSYAHREIKPMAAPMRGGLGALSLHRLDLATDVPAEQSPRGLLGGLPQIGDTVYVQRDDDAPTDAQAPSEEHNEADHDHESEDSPHAWVGISLVLGFILMYLIDIVPHLTSSNSRAARPMHISLSNLSRGAHDASSSRMNGGIQVSGMEEAPRSPQPASPSSGNSTTIGLVIHAIADGIALGASATSPAARTSFGFVVFLAIMLHKAPAAFGLTAVLLKQGLSKRSARAHLLVFSLAAPVGAFATWIGVNIVGAGGAGGDLLDQAETGGGEAASMWWTGVVLIFSGGTFLYVAMHAMQESAASSYFSHAHSHSYTYSETEISSAANGYGESGLLDPYGPRDSPQKKGPSVSETSLAVVGMLLPLFTQIGHAHAHG
ncbi:hypothetical protein LTS18_002759 [Coniosporium uncinatum]|uniref:Uncharacterized protein n=1 Tax=Coniosporium uncinatum TaxID=93489 RepID=A0ACC3D7S6_9PEZI|nr:hypothetical protein LTS18_002759 [Coniosporium uncinatum]